FLCSWRATIIPCVAVPVSLVGTFGIMYLFGFTLDNISLMALTVATGFVVDDAIVVLENITRHIEAGMPRMEATLLGAKEVAFTVLSMTISLCAVFLPIPLIGGPVGQLFKEFSITLSAAIGISLLVSLTTTPMLCALLLRPHVPATEKSRIKRWLDAKFDRLLAGYSRTLKWSLENGSFIMILLGIVIVLNVHLYGLLPKGFFPWMDQGRIQGGVRGDQSASFELTRTKIEAFEKILRADPAVESVQLTTGGNGGGGGGGFVSVTLKPKSVRKLNTEEVINRMRPMLAEVPGANIFLFTPQDIRVGGRQGNSPFQYTLLSDDVEALREWGPKLEAALKEVPQLLDVSTDQQERGLETEIQIDRATASRFNLTTAQVANALQDAFAQRSVSTIYNQFNQYHVIMEVAKEFWQSPETLQDLFVSTFGQISGSQATAAVAGTTSAKGNDSDAAEAVRNQATNRIANTGRGAASTGAAVSTRVETMVPFASLSKYGSGSTPTSISHQGHFAAVTVSFSVAPGYALGDVTRVIPAVVNEIGMPPSIHGVFAGTAGAFQSSLSSGPYLILATIITIYIVLGILYESYVHPLTIISTLPTAGIGAFILLRSMDMELGLIAFIGLILLIGIVKKNAIIMVDFAIAARRDRGLSHHDAIYEACVLRFRPIMMTSAAAILGALPLAIGFGEGTELRRPLGVTIVGGLLVSQVLTIYTTPVIYLYLAQFGNWLSTSRSSFGATLRGWFQRRKSA
ncbi:MAG: efflux RND transporter permease subunit, partial [Rhodospirillaceae bacterium]